VEEKKAPTRRATPRARRRRNDVMQTEYMCVRSLMLRHDRRKKEAPHELGRGRAGNKQQGQESRKDQGTSLGLAGRETPE